MGMGDVVWVGAKEMRLHRNLKTLDILLHISFPEFLYNIPDLVIWVRSLGHNSLAAYLRALDIC